MIPGAFTYHRPDSVDAAVGLLAEWGDDARVIAGGHSLIPVMKQRITDISHLVDLAGVESMKGISVDGGTVTIGAMTTQHEMISSDALAAAAPIVREASLQIADPQVRYIGTIGGNVANGDPANDMPGLMQTLDATYHLAGPNGTRTVAAREFYEAAYFTACEDAVGVLVGSSLDDATVAAAVKVAVDASDPVADTRGPVDFKKYVAGVIVKKAIESARSRA